MTRDDAVFTAFVRAHEVVLARAAVLMTGDEHLAEDLLQAALAATYVEWPRLPDIDAALSFARRQLATTSRTWRRRRSNGEVRRPDADIDERATGDEAADVAERHRLLAALRELSARQRAVVVLRYYEDLTEAQTAELLGCSVGAVKAHGFRGLQRLRQLLGDDHLVPERAP